MAFRITRCASEADPHWLGLRRKLWPNVPAEQHRDQMRLAVARGGNFAAFIAHGDEREPLGFAEALLHQEAVPGCESTPAAVLEGLYVVPGHRREGVARRLLAEVGRWARLRGCKELASDTALDNTLAQQAHLSMGFVETARRVYFRRPLPPVGQEAGIVEIRAHFSDKGRKVVTFAGYSAGGYENPAAMIGHARAVMEELDRRTVIINAGGTTAGIGAVYDIAKSLGFSTTGIVSTLARDRGLELAPGADTVFYVKDVAWGGFVPGTTNLTPTSAAIVQVSDLIVAIGGGAIVRDELLGAQRAGRAIRFIAADRNHRQARERAAADGLPAPTDFKGEAWVVFGQGATRRAATESPPADAGGPMPAAVSRPRSRRGGDPAGG